MAYWGCADCCGYHFLAFAAHSPPHSGLPPPASLWFCGPVVRRVAVSSRGPGQSPVLPWACCVGSLYSDRCGLVSFPRQRIPVVGTLGLCRLLWWSVWGSFYGLCCPLPSALRLSTTCFGGFACACGPTLPLLHPASWWSTMCLPATLICAWPQLCGSRVCMARSLMPPQLLSTNNQATQRHGTAHRLYDTVTNSLHRDPCPRNTSVSATTKGQACCLYARSGWVPCIFQPPSGQHAARQSEPCNKYARSAVPCTRRGPGRA